MRKPVHLTDVEPGLPRRDDRHRGRQLLHQPRRQPQAAWPAPPGRTSAPAASDERARGHRRQLDHAAAGQERLHRRRRAPRALDRPQAARDRLRPGADQALRQGPDPRLVRQPDQLRRHLHRRRGRGQGYFGKPAKDLTLARSGAAGRHPAVARRLRPGAATPRPRWRGATRSSTCSSARHGPDRPKTSSTRRRRGDRRARSAPSRSTIQAAAFPIEAPHFVLELRRAAARGAGRQGRPAARRPRDHDALDLDLQNKAQDDPRAAGSRSSRRSRNSPQRRLAGHPAQDGRDPGHGRQPRLLPRRHRGQGRTTCWR